MVVDVGVDRGEFLQRLHLSKYQHRPLSSSEGQVAVFPSIVGMATDLLLLGVAEVSHRCLVRSQTISVDALRQAAALQRLLDEASAAFLSLVLVT